MHIPEHLQPHVEHGALIVLADSVQAHLWYAAKDMMDEVGTIALPRTLDTDHEGSFVNTDNGSVSSVEPSDDDRLHKFIKQMEHEVETQIQTHPVKLVHLVMPARIAHLLRNALSPMTQKLIGQEVDHDLIKTSMTEVLEKIFKV